MGDFGLERFDHIGVERDDAASRDVDQMVMVFASGAFDPGPADIERVAFDEADFGEQVQARSMTFGG